MMKKNIFSFGIICATALSLGFFGCESDDGDDGTSGAGGGGGGDTAGASGGGTNHCLGVEGDEGDGNNTFSGWVEDTVTGDRIGGMTVEVLDNTTAQKIGVSATTAEDGTFTIEGLDNGLMGLAVMATNSDPKGEQRIDTMTFNIPTNAKERFIVSTTKAIYSLIQEQIGAVYSPDEAAASGGVYYYDQDCKEWPIDCATVSSVPEGRLTYFGPTNLPDTNATETWPSGRFLLNDVPVVTGDIIEITAYVDGEPVGVNTMPLIAPKDSTKLPGDEFAYNSHVTRVYVDQMSDPTPNCAQSQ